MAKTNNKSKPKAGVTKSKSVKVPAVKREPSTVDTLDKANGFDEKNCL